MTTRTEGRYEPMYEVLCRTSFLAKTNRVTTSRARLMGYELQRRVPVIWARVISRIQQVSELATRTDAAVEAARVLAYGRNKKGLLANPGRPDTMKAI